MHNVESRDTQERAGGPDAFDGLGPETCQFVDAREMGCPQGGKVGSKWREGVLLQTTVGEMVLMDACNGLGTRR